LSVKARANRPGIPRRTRANADFGFGHT
jgi:hypothetical protein